jgi:outer membrane protein OmpA-like peptidoglycan-associated protein
MFGTVMQNSKLIRATLVVIIGFFAILSTSSAQKEYKLPENSYELLLRMNYESIVRLDLIAIGIDTNYYVPLLQIMSKLQVYHEFDYTNKIMKGYVVEQDSSFRLDFRTGNCESYGNYIKLEKDDFLVDQMEVYLRPEVFEKLFKFKVKLNYLKLMLTVGSKFDLPIKNTYQRFMGHSFLQDDGGARHDYAPLRYDRDPSVLNGGVLTYNLRGTTNNNEDINYGFSTNLGLEVLGGDFFLASSGNFQHRKENEMLIDTSGMVADTSFAENTLFSSNFNNRYKWRYFLGDNSYFTFFSIGNLTSSGMRTSSLPSTSFDGVQITNETTRNPIGFSSIIYEDYIEPDWEVELYKDGFLEEKILTDANGYYRFELPVDYGSSNIELRYYGPRGEYEVKKELIRIPNQFLQPGEIKYSLNLGNRSQDTMKYGEVRASLGINNWLSGSFSFIKLDSAIKLDDLFKSTELGSLKNTNYFSSFAIRLRSDLFATYDFAYKNYQSIDFKFWPLDYGSYNLKYTVYDNHRVFNGSDITKLEARVQLPRLFELPFSFGFNYNRVNSGLSKSNNFSTNFNFNIDRIRFNTSYQASLLERPGAETPVDFQHNSNFGVSYNIMRMPSFLEFISSMSFSLSNSFDLTENKLLNQSLSINQMLFKKLNLNFNLRKSYSSSNDVSFTVGIRYDFGSFKSRTDMSGSTVGDRQYSQQIEGVLGYSSELGEFLFSNSTIGASVGNGAANIRVFVDANGNDEYDEGEVMIPGVRISIPSATTNYRDQAGMIQAYNLRAYERYNLTVDKNSFKNPLWIPKYEEFSFIADPNVFKQIDIPCYVGGVLQGGVSKVDSNGTSGQAGVKVHVMSVDSSFTLELPVFSDGSFYHIGLAPGDYIAYVDSMQLGVLKSNSEPAIIEFNVKATETGDFVDNIQFELVPIGFDRKKYIKEQESQLMVPGSNLNENKLDLPVEIEDFIIIKFNNSTDATLNDKMRTKLDSLLEYLNASPETNIEVVGHTDAFSPNEYIRMEVSEERAFAVKDYLINNGINKERISATGKGSISPIADNTTSENRKKNRRVEIKILK